MLDWIIQVLYDQTTIGIFFSRNQLFFQAWWPTEFFPMSKISFYSAVGKPVFIRVRKTCNNFRVRYRLRACLK